MRPERVIGEEAVARFRREAKVAAGFSHPNVVTIHDFGVADDSRAYLVMELLDGCGLREELLRCVRLESKHALEILRGVASAVTAAHEQKLLHRDLKPENIFLARSGQAEVAKILDFGLAKALAPGGGTESMTQTAPGMLIGTLPYMSPEQIRGEPPAESWDLWAIAIVAFEMLAGVHPFGTSADWRSVLIKTRLPPLNLDVPALTPQLREFFERCLSVDRAQRPASVRHFMVELQAAL
jgi:serine/threonine-protein kinase